MKRLAFIWDMDGTLVDSYPAIVPAARETLAEFGVRLTAEEIHREVIATSVGALLERIQELVGVRASVVVDPALVRPADASIHLDVTRLRHTCGWTPKFTFDQTLRDMIAALRAKN